MKILVLNGPNLNLLGKREPEVYGTRTLQEIMDEVAARGRDTGTEVSCFQSNEEGVLVTRIGESAGKVDGIIFNPGGYSHTSIALRDAVKAFPGPCIEVHLSNIHAREDFRHTSMVAGACVGQISGFGGLSYMLALDAIVEYLRREKSKG
jgi:3-dehydroquinate dehydratase-2